MNKDNAHLYLPLVQALADGALQVRNGCTGTWVDWTMTACEFSRPPEHYRRKPKPREWWHVISPQGEVWVVRSTEQGAVQSRPSSAFTVVHVREVT